MSEEDLSSAVGWDLVLIVEMRETSRESPPGEGEHQTKHFMHLDYSFIKTGVVAVLITGDAKVIEQMSVLKNISIMTPVDFNDKLFYLRIP